LMLQFDLCFTYVPSFFGKKKGRTRYRMKKVEEKGCTLEWSESLFSILPFLNVGQNQLKQSR